MKTPENQLFICQHVTFPKLGSMLDLYKMGVSFHFHTLPVRAEVYGTLQNSHAVIVYDAAGNVKEVGRFNAMKLALEAKGFTRDQIRAGFEKAAHENRLRVVKEVLGMPYFKITHVFIEPEGRNEITVRVLKADFGTTTQQTETHHGTKFLMESNKLILFNKHLQPVYQLTDFHQVEIAARPSTEKFRITETDLIIHSKA